MRVGVPVIVPPLYSRWSGRYRLVSNATWTAIPARVAGNEDLTPLTPGATYVAQVRWAFAVAAASEWSDTKTVTLPT
jgi:histidinol dehydrogenase